VKDLHTICFISYIAFQKSQSKNATDFLLGLSRIKMYVIQQRFLWNLLQKYTDNDFLDNNAIIYETSINAPKFTKSCKYSLTANFMIHNIKQERKQIQWHC